MTPDDARCSTDEFVEATLDAIDATPSFRRWLRRRLRDAADETGLPYEAVAARVLSALVARIRWERRYGFDC